MISWIQRYFQRHFKWLFLGLLACTVISFVFITNASSGLGSAGPKQLSRPFFGYDLSREQDQRRVFGDANYSVLLRFGFPAQGAQLQQYALQRVASLALADQLHLPEPTPAEVEAHIAGLAFFQNADGKFDPALYQRFGDSLKGNNEFTTADAARVIRNDARIDRLQKLLGGPGYVLPHEVRNELVRSDSTWSIQVAALDYASFAADVPVTDDALARFYEEYSFRYQVPERRRLALVEFKAADYAAAGTPSEDDLRAYYNQNPARFPVPPEAGKDATPSIAPQTPGDDFPKVRAQVEAALREEIAVQNAARAANDLTVALYEATASARNADLGSVVAARGKSTTPVAPFPADQPPAGLEWVRSHIDQVERLGPDRRFSDALRTPTGYAVLLWEETLPPYQPLLNEVREKVAADYRENEKSKRFAERGRELKSGLEAAVKAGTPFEKAAADAGLEVTTHANFTFRQPPPDLPSTIFQALPSLSTGQITDMIRTRENKGVFAYVQARQEPDVTPGSPRYAETKADLSGFGVAATSSALLGAMIAAEQEKWGAADGESAP